MAANHVQNVAIVGAGGNSGAYMTQELLKTGKHTVTALTRPDSQSKLPDGVIVKKVDYEKPETIVEALKGQDVLVITMSVFAPPGQQMKLVDAAAKAGVKFVMPNHWSPDSEDASLANDVIFFDGVKKFQDEVEAKGEIPHISLSTGFWYEWSLSIPDAYGFDLTNRKVTFFDEGDVKISTSTWPQVGRAVAALLSLPLKGTGSSKGLEDFFNKVMYTNSFTVSQQDMLDSVLRVSGTQKADWTITKQPAVERYTKGIENMKKGDRSGFSHMMYTRVFYPDGNGDFESRRGTLNSLLGLPKEDLDQATEAAIARAKVNPNGYGA